MIADLLRAFVEALVVREVQKFMPPGQHVEKVAYTGGWLCVTWSEA